MRFSLPALGRRALFSFAARITSFLATLFTSSPISTDAAPVRAPITAIAPVTASGTAPMTPMTKIAAMIMPTAASIALSFALLAAFATAAAPVARAQNFADNSKWELGGHYAFLTLPSQCTGSPSCEANNSGLGANLTYNFSSWIGVDTEMNFFGNNGDAATNLTGGAVTEGLFGVRFGPTTRRWGLYSVIRPGFVNFSSVLANGQPGAGATGAAFPITAATPQFSASLNYQTPSPSPAALAMLGFTRATDFAFNYGEAIEYRPTKHAALRLDIGDTIVSYPGSTLGAQYHQHNFQISQAIVIRF
ncbi:MAG: outer membrane beta-barrel protein [Candidatus Acidiferrales bacterium]